MEGGPRVARFLPSLILLLSLSPSDADGGCYSNGRDNYFDPGASDTFQLVKFGNVNLTFLDNTHLEGHDGQDLIRLGEYKVETRFGMIEKCSSVTFNNVDGILGFGWAGGERSAALLKTLTQRERPGWDVDQGPDFEPMARKFAFTANYKYGEVQLGGYDEDSTDGEMVYFPMETTAYGVNISSIKYGTGDDAVELLHFNPDHRHARTSYVGQFDSGTTCLLLPNSTGLGYLKSSPFQQLLQLQLAGVEAPLVYTLTDVNGVEREYTLPYSACVEPTPYGMILGDPWFRGWVVMHDLENLENPKMGLAPRNKDYDLDAEELFKDERSQVLARSARAGGASAGSGAGGRAGKKGAGSGVQKLKARRTVAVPQGQTLTQVLAPGAVSKVALEAPTRVVYDVNIDVGTPPQEMKVIFDTGSYMLAIFSKHPPADLLPLEGRGSVATLRELTSKGYKAVRDIMRDARHQRRGLEGQLGQLQKLQEGRKEAMEGPDVQKALLIRKAIQRMRKSGVKEAKVGDELGMPVVTLQVGGRGGGGAGEGGRAGVMVSRVPALIGVNAVLVAAVVGVAVRLLKRRSMGEGRELMGSGEEGYGSLSQEEGAQLL